MHFLKKSLLSLLAFLILFQGSVVPALAQSNQWYDSSILNWYTKVYDTQTSQPQEIFGERYTAAQVQWVIYSLIVLPMNLAFSSEFTACWLSKLDSGSDIGPCFLIPGFWQFFQKVANFIKAFVPGAYVISSDLAVSQDMNFERFTSMVFTNRSNSGIAYITNKINRFSLIPEAKAQQGFGYGALDILQPLWLQSRNMAYGLLILAAIIMAFMIMFRTKVSPQAVITVQSAIPKLIIAIVLITFSYAIAGLAIDLMYVVIGMIAAILGGSAGAIQSMYVTMTDGPGGTGIFGMMLVYSVLFPIFLMVSLLAAGGLAAGGGIAGGALGGTALGQLISGSLLMSIVVILAFAILAIVLFFAFFKIMFMLIKTLVSTYLLVVFAPFYILGGAVSSSLGFGSWIKDMIANLAVFPAVGVMFVFSLIFLNASGGASFSVFPPQVQDLLNDMFSVLGLPQIIAAGTGGWAPPLLGFGANSGGLMVLFVSLGIILMLPKVADIIKSFVSQRPFAYGSAIGEAVTGGISNAVSTYKLPGQIREFTGFKRKGTG